ncbi:MAG: NAD(P)/FAD-dependent oxidoreductase [Thermomicrobiales bacterium]
MQRVVIVGGGVIGLSAAFALERRGCQVTVIEARTPGHGASFVNAGWVTPSLAGPLPAPGLVRTSLRWMLHADSPLYIRPRIDPDLLRWLVAFWRRCNARAYQAGLEATAELNRRTMPLYDDLAAAGVAFEMHRAGLLLAACSPAALEADLAEIEPLRSFGIEVRGPLHGDELRELEPALGPAITGALWVASERHVRPDSLTQGLVRYLHGRGVVIHTGTTVTGFEASAGRVSAVLTDRERFAADAAVICAGAWTGKVARMAGVQLPFQGGKGYCLDFVPPPREVRHPIYLHEARVAVTPLHGMVRLAGTMEFSGLNETIRPARVAAIARQAARCLTGWPAEYRRATVGCGLRPMTPDGLPVIGLLPGYRNLAVASGHAMLGVTLAPATAEALADLMTTGQAPPVLKPFDAGRFRQQELRRSPDA